MLSAKPPSPCYSGFPTEKVDSICSETTGRKYSKKLEVAGYDLPFIVNKYIFISAILIFIEIGQV